MYLVSDKTIIQFDILIKQFLLRLATDKPLDIMIAPMWRQIFQWLTFLVIVYVIHSIQYIQSDVCIEFLNVVHSLKQSKIQTKFSYRSCRQLIKFSNLNDIHTFNTLVAKNYLQFEILSIFSKILDPCVPSLRTIVQ